MSECNWEVTINFTTGCSLVVRGNNSSVESLKNAFKQKDEFFIFLYTDHNKDSRFDIIDLSKACHLLAKKIKEGKEDIT